MKSTKVFSLFVLVAVISLFASVSPVVAAPGNGNNGCPDGTMEGHFCARPVGNPNDNKVAEEWANPSCSVLPLFEQEKGWELKFTENCNTTPTPEQPAPEPTQQPTNATETTSASVGTCENDQCQCIEFGPNTLAFLREIADRFFDLFEKLIDKL